MDDHEIGCLNGDHNCTEERIERVKEWIGNVSLKMDDHLKKVFENVNNCADSFFKPDCRKCERSK